MSPASIRLTSSSSATYTVGIFCDRGAAIGKAACEFARCEISCRVGRDLGEQIVVGSTRHADSVRY